MLGFQFLKNNYITLQKRLQNVNNHYDKNIMKLKEIAKVFIAVIIVALLLRTFVVDSFIVQGDSMSPSILEGDYIFIDRLSYLFGGPKRGDIVVVQPRASSVKIIKRVVGLPGERIAISNLDGKLYLKSNRKDLGEVLKENYLNFPYLTPNTGIKEIKLDPQEYFVLGDNRLASTDSRELGPVDKWKIKGRVFFVVHPRLFEAKLFK